MPGATHQERVSGRFRLTLALWLLAVLASAGPATGHAQAPPVDEPRAVTNVSMLLVLVEDHDFGPAPAVIRTYPHSPLPHLDPVVLIRAADASPRTISLAAQTLLTLQEEGLLDTPRELAIPVPNISGSATPPAWAARAFARLRSSTPVQVPELFGEAELQTFGISVQAELIRQLDLRRPDS